MREINQMIQVLHSKYLIREMTREIRELPSISAAKLHRRSRRNKKLMKLALEERRRYEYRARRALSKLYGAQIAIKMRQV